MPTTEIVSILKILELLQSWPVWIVAIILLQSPWIAVIYLWRNADKRAVLAEQAAADRAAAHDLKSAENLAVLTKIAQAGWEAYKDNVELVKETQAVAKQAVELSKELSEIISLNTANFAELSQRVKMNIFCPIVRKQNGVD